MLSYFFGSALPKTEEPTEQQDTTKDIDVPTRDGELGWVIVDTPGGDSDRSENPQQPHHLHDNILVPVESLEGDSTCSSDPESVGSQNTSTPESVSPGGHRRVRFAYRSKLDSAESWILTPPPCFTARRKNSCNIDTNPLENLLIEHPSMSVYTSLECEHEDEEEEEKKCSDVHEVDEMEVDTASNDAAVVAAVACEEKKRVAHHPPRRAHAVAARAGLTAQIENIKVAQREQARWSTKKLSRKMTNKENKVREFSALGKQQSKRARLQRPSGCMNGRIGQRKV